jgi:hypothetical protein
MSRAGGQGAKFASVLDEKAEDPVVVPAGAHHASGNFRKGGFRKAGRADRLAASGAT